MGFIESIYIRTMTLLDTLGQSQYQAVASDLAQTTQIVSTLVAVLVLINMGLQVRPMEVGSSIWLIFKLVLVALFMRSWTDFNGVFEAVESGFEALGNSLLSGALGLGETVTSFPRELDNLSDNFGQYANVTAGRMNILGGMLNALIWCFIAVFGALATLAMIASRVVLAVMIALAPFAIMATLTAQTKSYFDTWLSGVIKVLMYPLILIGIFATILGMGNATISGLPNPDEITTIGQVTPILTVLVLAGFLVLLSPVIVTLVVGDFALGAITAVAGGALKRAGGSAGSFVGGAGRAATGMAAAEPKSAAQRGAALGSAASSVAGDTAGFMKNPIANTRDGVNLRANQINRVAERMARLRRK